MTLNIPSRWLARPSHLSMAAVALSFFAWLFPSFGELRKGFDIPQQLDATAIVVLGLWYLLIFAGFSAGQAIGEFAGRSLRGRFEYPAIDSNTVYRAFTLLTFIGTATMIAKVFQILSPQLAFLAIAGGQANRITGALQENYHVGFVSLRYLTVYSSALALQRSFRHRRLSLLALVNFAMLLFNATARLILMATLLSAMFLMFQNRKVVRLQFRKALATALIAFTMLSGVNYARNSRYYASVGSSFWLAGVSEILAYLGSPFQCAIGTAKVLDTVADQKGDSYRLYVDVEEALNTNSAFVGLHSQMGYAAWPFIGCICLLMGFLFAAMRGLGQTAFLLPAAGILYGSTELWRVDLYEQGIFMVWLLCGIGVPVSLLLLQSFAKTLRTHYPRRSIPV